MKKRVKKRVQKPKKKISFPLVLFVLGLIFIVYTGIVGIMDKFLIPSENSIEGSLATISPNTFPVILLLILIILFIILFLNLKVKKRKKNKASRK